MGYKVAGWCSNRSESAGGGTQAGGAWRGPRGKKKRSGRKRVGGDEKRRREEGYWDRQEGGESCRWVEGKTEEIVDRRGRRRSMGIRRAGRGLLLRRPLLIILFR